MFVSVFGGIVLLIFGTVISAPGIYETKAGAQAARERVEKRTCEKITDVNKKIDTIERRHKAEIDANRDRYEKILKSLSRIEGKIGRR